MTLRCALCARSYWHECWQSSVVHLAGELEGVEGGMDGELGGVDCEDGIGSPPRQSMSDHGDLPGLSLEAEMMKALE